MQYSYVCCIKSEKNLLCIVGKKRKGNQILCVQKNMVPSNSTCKLLHMLGNPKFPFHSSYEISLSVDIEQFQPFIMYYVKYIVS